MSKEVDETWEGETFKKGRVYTDEQTEWLREIDRLKAGRLFPGWTEVLAMAKKLGYSRPGFDAKGNRLREGGGV